MTEGTCKDGFRAILPLLPAVAAFGASFGVLARAAGIDSLAAIVSVLGAGGTAAAAIGAAVLLNARHVPMGFAAAGAFRGGPLRRLLEAQLLVDESWALSRGERSFDRRVLVGAGGLLYMAWIAGTAAGVLAGDSLTDPATLGLDAAFPALFLALLGAAIALVLTPFTPAGLPLIAATGACLIGLRRPPGRRERARAERRGKGSALGKRGAAGVRPQEARS